MKVNKIVEDSYANGPGRRFTIWTQGCSIRCNGCCNTHTWDFNGGEEISIDELERRIETTKPDGITITGGEPLDQYNQTYLLAKRMFDRYNIFLTTGYERIPTLPIYGYVDILVSGRYVKGLPDNTSSWRGSSNQKIEFLTERGKQLENSASSRIEIRIDKKTGDVFGTGFVDPKKIKQILEVQK